MYPGYDKNSLEKVLSDLDSALSTLNTPLVSFVDPLFGGDKKQTIPLLDALRGATSSSRFTRGLTFSMKRHSQPWAKIAISCLLVLKRCQTAHWCT